MAFSNSKLVTIDNKNFQEVTIWSFTKESTQLEDRDFDFGYMYWNDGKHYHKVFHVKKNGKCDNKDFFVKRISTGTYLIRWKGMDDRKVNLIITVI